MVTGIIITTYNRHEYLWHCFESLKRADLTGCVVVIVDDCSTDYKTRNLVAEFSLLGMDVVKIWNTKNEGVRVCIRKGIESVMHCCNMFMTLDGDAMVRHDFVSRILELPRDAISTGFHCTTKNSDGSERHFISGETAGYYLKDSVGGINMAFHKQTYIDHVEPALLKVGNWDHNACLSLQSVGKKVYCVKESVIQHLGLVSAMGHTGVEAPDTADDFYLYDLPNVTLIGAAPNDYQGLRKSMERCTKHIRFGEVIMLTSEGEEGTTYIPPIRNKDEYSLFCLRKLTDYVKTDYMIVFQPDGTIVNPCAWDNRFLEYDYIGAVWNFYNDNHRVGNGGFSLRSKKLMNITKNDPNIIPRNEGCFYYAEDHQIARLYRNYLESRYDIKFAPEEVANRFSLENYKVPFPNNKYNDSFGVHGKGLIDYRDAYIKDPNI